MLFWSPDKSQFIKYDRLVDIPLYIFSVYVCVCGDKYATALSGKPARMRRHKENN